jgi:hypothetical protein
MCYVCLQQPSVNISTAEGLFFSRSALYRTLKNPKTPNAA